MYKKRVSERDVYTHIYVYKEENVKIGNPKSKIKLLQDVRDGISLVSS